MSRTDTFEKLAACVPVSRDAARVVGRGASAASLAPLTNHWADQPPLKAITALMRASEGWRDFTGVQVGRIKVVGLLDGKAAGRRATWVCRCVCGDFCGFSSRTLRSMVDAGEGRPQCGRCARTASLRNGHAPKAAPRLQWESAWSTRKSGSASA